MKNRLHTIIDDQRIEQYYLSFRSDFPHRQVKVNDRLEMRLQNEQSLQFEMVYGTVVRLREPLSDSEGLSNTALWVQVDDGREYSLLVLQQQFREMCFA